MKSNQTKLILKQQREIVKLKKTISKIESALYCEDYLSYADIVYKIRKELRESE